MGCYGTACTCHQTRPERGLSLESLPLTIISCLLTIIMAPPAPKTPYSTMPPKTADLEETWAFLNTGVDHIMTRLDTGLSFPDYTNLYSTVYNFCTSTKMHGKMDGNRSKRHKFVLISYSAELRSQISWSQPCGRGFISKAFGLLYRAF